MGFMLKINVVWFDYCCCWKQGKTDTVKFPPPLPIGFLCCSVSLVFMLCGVVLVLTKQKKTTTQPPTNCNNNNNNMIS